MITRLTFPIIFVRLTLFGCWSTRYEWVSSESTGTRTRRQVINDITSCSQSTHSVARITALSLYTRLVAQAFWINWTFGSAIGWRSYISWQASTRCLTVNIPTLRKGSAGWRRAEIYYLDLIFSYRHTNVYTIMRIHSLSNVFGGIKIVFSFLRGISKQATNGSPVKSIRHEHMGLWLIVSHLVLEPHNPRQGSPHLLLMHAWLKAHSELTVHSGRQFGGLPRKVGKQVQTLVLSTTRHLLFGPQGDGSQGRLTAFSPSKNDLCISRSVTIDAVTNKTQVKLQNIIPITTGLQYKKALPVYLG